MYQYILFLDRNLLIENKCEKKLSTQVYGERNSNLFHTKVNIQ